MTGTEKGPSTSAASLVADGTAAGDWTLDPAATRIEFHSASIWGLVKVHGWFTTVSGSGRVTPDGAVTGELVVDAASLDTKNKRRDDHLRSADFFDVASHPTVTYTVEGVVPADGDQVEVRGTLAARGQSESLPFKATVTEATADAVTLEAEVNVDRARFGMTWSPMKVATTQNRVVVKARLRRAGH
jgi:polyisoprenoid-binding protein YceI